MSIDRRDGEERLARTLLEEASAMLHRARSDIPAGFPVLLYGRAVPEDIMRYAAADLARLAERSYDFIADRAPGNLKIRCEQIELSGAGALSPFSGTSRTWSPSQTATTVLVVPNSRLQKSSTRRLPAGDCYLP